MPVIKSIVYKPEFAHQEPDSKGYLRLPLTEAVLNAGYGIAGDRKGGNPKRNLNVMDAVTLAELAAEGYPAGEGTLGENIILDGLDLRTLPVGTLLRLGDDAVIRLGELRVPCHQLTQLDARMPDGVYERVGVMCRVVTTGKIKVGDPVEIVPAINSVNSLLQPK
ncbi:MAG: MOSC domain-containing protein [Anaerolineae bacterium]|nr:MOSC domain-containing protein [Anaerolineae bacterium]